MARKSTSGSPKILSVKPVNIFLKPVTVNFRELFKTIAKGVGHTIAHKWDELAADAVEALTSLDLVTEPGEIAYGLVQRALVISKLLHQFSHSPNPSRTVAGAQLGPNGFRKREQ